MPINLLNYQENMRSSDLFSSAIAASIIEHGADFLDEASSGILK